MGLNAFFTYTLIINGGVPWPVALGIIFWAGVVFLLVSATPLRERIAMAIPPSLRSATAAGIGLLLTFIGLQNAGFVAANPATMVGVGPLDHRALLTLGGVDRQRVAERAATIRSPISPASRWSRRSRGSRGYVTPPASWFSAPDFSSVFLKLDIWGALQAGRWCRR